MNGSGFYTIGKILNGTKNVISAVDKIVPLYKEIKPLISKFKDLKMKLNNIDLSKFKLNNVQNNEKKEQEKKEISFPSSNPQFFI